MTAQRARRAGSKPHDRRGGWRGCLEVKEAIGGGRGGAVVKVELEASLVVTTAVVIIMVMVIRGAGCRAAARDVSAVGEGVRWCWRSWRWWWWW